MERIINFEIIKENTYYNITTKAIGFTKYNRYLVIDLFGTLETITWEINNIENEGVSFTLG